MVYAALLVLGTVVGIVGGIFGFGTSILLLPVLTMAFGAKQAIPIMAVAALMANLMRVFVWRHEIDWKAWAAYTVPSIPATMLGASIFVALPTWVVELLVGLFLLLSLAANHAMHQRRWRIKLWQLSCAGVVTGFLVGLFYLVGPINIPFFLGYGLTKGGIVGTEAFGAVVILLSKLATLTVWDFMTWAMLWRGMWVGGSLMMGTWLAKHVLDRLDMATFRLWMNIYILLVAIGFIGHALWAIVQNM